MPRQPNTHDSPNRLYLRPDITDDQRLKLRDAWAAWNAAWAEAANNVIGHNQRDLDAACDFAMTQYAQLIRRFSASKT